MKQKKQFFTAHEIASEPDLYNRAYKIGKSIYECIGYSRTGNTVRFGDVIPMPDKTLKLVIKYISPDTLIELAESS